MSADVEHVGHVEIFDTTLRDGTQGENITLSLADKLRVARMLDEYGMPYIEGGWPGSNPKDIEFFAAARSRRATAALARAADRRSGVSGGRATDISLGRADGQRRCQRTYPWPDSPRNDTDRAGGRLRV